MQAAEALKLLPGAGMTLNGKLLVTDALHYEAAHYYAEPRNYAEPRMLHAKFVDISDKTVRVSS